MEDLSFSGYYGIATTSYITYFTSTAQIAAQEGDYLVFSFVNPAAPVFVTAMQPSSAPGSGNLNLKPYANVVGSAVLDVINLTIPTIPSPVSQVTIPEAAILLSFDVSGNTLLAAGNTPRGSEIPAFRISISPAI